ncbi:MAG: AMP-binding protein [Pseudomonadota bacterium]
MNTTKTGFLLDKAHSFHFNSHISKTAWPPVLNPWAGGVISLLYQLDQTQWWPLKDIEQQQLRQANILVKHSVANSPFYQALFQEHGITTTNMTSWEEWRQLPIIDRKMLQAATKDWQSQIIPEDHGQQMEYFTSGSTGMPLRSCHTTLGLLFKTAMVLRQHHWSQENTQLKAAYIQESSNPHAAKLRFAKNWETLTNNVIETGPAMVMSPQLSTEEHLAHLCDFQPNYLFSYPSIIATLAKHAIKHGIDLPFLQQIGTYGEVLEPHTRHLVKHAWGIDVTDGYSAKEIGPIALQCPHAHHYHVQSEALIVEVLNNDNEPCKPGEIGRLVITVLHNFSHPIIRYAIGDYAIPGDPCACGRNLPVLEKIIGRQRNMLLYPDGSQRWPSLKESDLSHASQNDFPAIHQFQILQHSVERLEAKVVTEKPWSIQEEHQIVYYLKNQLGSHWQIDISYQDHIERGKNGKFEDFISYCQA